MITGIRGLCNGLGPALYGFIFYIFHVELKELPMTGTDLGTNTSPQHHFEQVKRLWRLTKAVTFPLLQIDYNT